MSNNLSQLRAAIAKEEERARRKMVRIKAGTYNPRGKRSVLSEIVPTEAELKRKRNRNPYKGRPLPHYGVDIEGTEYDPLRNSKNYGRKRLESYLERLKGFNTPSVGYFKGMNGTIITAQTMRSLIRANRANNQRKSSIVESNRDVFVPWLNQTVGEYDERTRKNTYPSDSGGWDLKQYDTPTPANLTPKGARDLLDKIASVSSPWSLEHLSDANQRSIEGMLPYLSDTARNAVANIDPWKLAFAVQHDESFFDRLHELYVIMASGGESEMSAMIANEAEEAFLTYLEDVSALELR